jgi:hypothetical protein
MFFSNFNLKNIIIYSFYLVLALFIFSKEFIVINEEFLIILSFLAVFFSLKNVLSDLIKIELEDRNYQIKKQFIYLYDTKLNYQKILIVILEKKIELLNLILNYINLFENNIKSFILNRNLILKEFLNNYIEQFLSMYIIKFNYELKISYIDIINSIRLNMNANN